MPDSSPLADSDCFCCKPLRVYVHSILRSAINCPNRAPPSSSNANYQFLYTRAHTRSPAANWAQLKSWNLEDTFPATGYCFVSLLEKLALFLSDERLLLPLTTRPSVAVFAYVVVVAVCTDCSTRRRSFFFLFLFFGQTSSSQTGELCAPLDCSLAYARWCERERERTKHTGKMEF